MNYLPLNYNSKDAVSDILTALEFRGEMTEDDFYQMGRVMGVKYDTYKRRLREMTGLMENGERHENFNPKVKPLYENGVLVMYYWDKDGVGEARPADRKMSKAKTCCPSNDFFPGHHNKFCVNCREVGKNILNKLF